MPPLRVDRVSSVSVLFSVVSDATNGLFLLAAHSSSPTSVSPENGNIGYVGFKPTTIVLGLVIGFRLIPRPTASQMDLSFPKPSE
jgi:hypothetical protein